MTLRAIVVDDSTVYRKVVRDCLAEIPDVAVVDVARDGLSAVAKIKQHRPDVVTLDVEMPGLNGLEVLKELQREKVSCNVIMLSSFTERGADVTTQSLETGAFDFILKPNDGDALDNARQLKHELESRIAVLTRRSAGGSPNPARVSQAKDSQTRRVSTTLRDLDAVCIGISTGGPKALSQLVSQLSGTITAPILIVQHMPPLFTESLAKGLDAQSALSIQEATHHAQLQSGHVYVAPGGKHMLIGGFPGNWRIEIADDPPLRNCKPSVDYLFQSCASQFKDRLLGIVMTGMGDDGVAGCKAIRQRNGKIWAQNEETSTVFGMPRAVIEAQLTDRVLSLDEIACGLNELARKSRLATR